MCWLCGSPFLRALCTQHENHCAAICLSMTGLQLFQNTGIFLERASLVEHHLEPSNAVPFVWAPLRQASAACCNSYKSRKTSLSPLRCGCVWFCVAEQHVVRDSSFLSKTGNTCVPTGARCCVLSHSHSSWHAGQYGKQSRACQLHHHRRITPLHWCFEEKVFWRR